MRVSIEWLKEHVDVELSPDELAEALSMSGTSVERVVSIGEGVSGVVVGKVLEVTEHRDAAALRVCKVDDGSGVRQVVCGAPNVREGLVSALALPGARLPGLSGREVQGVKIRGVESDGMLASGAELGINEDADGIIELASDMKAGIDIQQAIPVKDVVLDLEITPNRPDCMSVVGIAREIAALTGTRLKTPPAGVGEDGEDAGQLVSVIIEDGKKCPRYTARVVTGVEVDKSPAWMQMRLLASGLRPINNVVDVTNYVLMELGQPLHAFDLQLLEGRTIIVRLARQGEPLLTLDGVERQLDGESLVIADASKPVALAGVMGGEETEVGPATSSILIESAYFEPTSIMRTSRRLGIRTEASARFERGTDPEVTAYAALRAARLMAEHCGGTVARNTVDVYPEPILPVEIQLRQLQVNRILGTSIEKAEMVEILEGLEMQVSQGEELRITVPTFRVDLEREIDLVEEIARIYGYDKIPSSIPGGGGVNAGLTARQSLEHAVTEVMVSMGFLQVICQSFTSSSELDLMMLDPDDWRRRVVSLMNPLAETGELMRTTILPGLIRVAANNVNKGNRDLEIFEMAPTFLARQPGELPEEIENLGILMCGKRGVPFWGGQSAEIDFYDIKGVVENLALALKVEDLEFETGSTPFMTTGQCADVLVKKEIVGTIGRLDTEVASAFGLEGDFFAGEISVGKMLDVSKTIRGYKAVGKFPGVKVDVALVVGENIESRQVEEKIRLAGSDQLVSVRLFDVYRGPQVQEGKKSLAFALEFSSMERTLTDDEVHGELDRIVKELEKDLEATLRSRDVGRG